MTEVQFSGQLCLGHFLRLRTRPETGQTSVIKYAFQNFYFGENKNMRGVDYVFIPFGFSGITTSRQGDTEPAALTFPNVDKAGMLVRSWISEALRGENINNDDIEGILFPYIGEVDVYILNPEGSDHKLLYTYTGQCVAASWNDTEAILELGSVLDAVSGDLPTRTLRRDLVGNLPTSGSVRVR